jgi:hypothetical protein
MPLPGPFASPKERAQFREAKSQLPFFPGLPGRLAPFCEISRLEEHLFRSLICQAVMMTRWEQNK